MLARAGIAIATRGLEYPIALLHAGAHFLEGLAAVLFALKLALRGEDRLDEFALGRVVEIVVQAFDACAAGGELRFELEMEFRVAGEALEIVEDDDVALFRLGIEIGEHGAHAGALHEVAAARRVVREHGFDVVALLWDPALDRRRLEFPGSVMVTGWLRHRDCAHRSGPCTRSRCAA